MNRRTAPALTLLSEIGVNILDLIRQMANAVWVYKLAKRITWLSVLLRLESNLALNKYTITFQTFTDLHTDGLQAAAQRYHVHKTSFRENLKNTKVVCPSMWTYDITTLARTMTIIDKIMISRHSSHITQTVKALKAQDNTSQYHWQSTMLDSRHFDTEVIFQRSLSTR